MHNLDERLADGLHGIVDGEADSAPPVGQLLERGRRARRRRTSAVAGSTLAVLALAALGVAAVAQPESTAPDVTAGAARAQAQSPDLKLTSAFATSKDISYRIRLTTGELVYNGAFDPATDTGYVKVELDDSVQTELLIKGTRYIGGERPKGELPADKEGPGEKYGRYGQYPGKHDQLSLYDAPGSVLGSASPDPRRCTRSSRRPTPPSRRTATARCTTRSPSSSGMARPRCPATSRSTPTAGSAR